MIWAREHVLSATEHTVWEAEIDFALGRQPSWALLTQASEPPPGPQTLPQTLSQRVDSRLAASPTPLGPRLLCWKSVLKILFFSKYLEKIFNISKISEIFNNMVFFLKSLRKLPSVKVPNVADLVVDLVDVDLDVDLVDVDLAVHLVLAHPAVF